MSFYIDDTQDYYRAKRREVEQTPYGPQPVGPLCYCGRANNPLDCFFPTCSGRHMPEAQPTDWAKVYAKMDRK